MPPENIKNLWFSGVSKGYKKLTLTLTDLILVAYRNYNILQSLDSCEGLGLYTILLGWL